MPQDFPFSFQAIFARAAGPVFVFGIVLFAGVLAISFLFSPGRYPVETGDKVIRLRELVAEEQSLRGRELALLKEKQTIASLTPMPTLTMARSIRDATPPLFAAFGAIGQARSIFALNTSDPITIDHAALHNDWSIRFSGYVRDDGGRSLQLLASFVDRLREHQMFASVTEPEYQETLIADGIRAAPFTITVHPTHEK